MNAISLLYQTVYVLGQICLFRAKPTSLPFSWFVLGVLVAVDCALNVYNLTLLKGKIPADLSLMDCYVAATLSVIALIAMAHILLSKRQLGSRLNKFMVAFFGTDLMIAGAMQLIDAAVQTPLPMLHLALAIWRLAIQVHIIQCTFEVKMVQAMFLLIAIIFAASVPLWFIVGMNLQPQP